MGKEYKHIHNAGADRESTLEEGHSVREAVNREVIDVGATSIQDMKCIIVIMIGNHLSGGSL
jgi:hypothetical protein